MKKNKWRNAQGGLTFHSSELVRLLGKCVGAHEDLAATYREMGLLKDAEQCDEKVKAWRRKIKSITKQPNVPVQQRREEPLT